MITAGATPTPKTIDQRRVALTSPQVKTLQTDNAGTLGRKVVRLHHRTTHRRGDHRSVQALEADIRNWIKAWNEDPKPFIWTKTAEQILGSIERLMQRVNGAGH